MRRSQAALIVALISVAAIVHSQEKDLGSRKRAQNHHQTKQHAHNTTTEQRGTAQAPLFVEVVPTAETGAETSAKRNARREQAQEETTKAQLDRKLVDYNGDLAFYTKVLAWFAGFQFLALLAQIVFLKLAFSESKRSGDTAREAMIVSNRAYIHYGDCRWISHRDPARNVVFWRLHPRLVNTGDTPTRQLKIFVKYELLDRPLPDDFKYTVPPETDFPPIQLNIAAKGSIGAVNYDIAGDDLLAIREGRKRLYIWGVARYRDVFEDTALHVTKFCIEATDITANPMSEWDDKSNKVGITFRIHGTHNCEDDDCKDGQPGPYLAH